MIITRRELREIVRDYNLLLPIVFLPSLMAMLAGLTAFGSATGGSSAVSSAVTAVALQQFPEGALRELAQMRAADQQGLVGLLLKAIAIPLFWVIPVALTSAVAADSFVGEKERETLEPLLATPITNRSLFVGKLISAVVPAVLGTWLGVLLFSLFVALSRSPFYPPFLLSDADWAFSALVIAPLMATLAAGIAALISTRVSSYRAAYQLNGLVVLPVILVLIPQSVVLFVFSHNSLQVIATILAVLDLLVVFWAVNVFDRERLLGGR